MDDTLRIQDLDSLFKEELAREPGCQHLLRCFACGVCTATCPVAEIEPEFSPSRIIRQILYGMKEQLLASPSLWYCARCAQCSFACPQDVRFLDIIQGLRNLAVQQGAVSLVKAARLAQGERVIQDLRRRLVAALLAAPDDGLNIKEELSRVLAGVDIPAGEED
ncbi:MAG: 4Fe-4S dicluster domain-containing protein [Desulfobaccales bacterium]